MQCLLKLCCQDNHNRMLCCSEGVISAILTAISHHAQLNGKVMSKCKTLFISLTKLDPKDHETLSLHVLVLNSRQIVHSCSLRLRCSLDVSELAKDTMRKESQEEV